MLKQYYSINKATGISLHVEGDGSILINACGIEITNNQLNFTIKKTTLKDTEALPKYFDVKQAAALNLSGKGILQKQIEKTEIINQENFSKILPNANFTDFYIQNFISGQFSYVSVIRKTEADKWLNNLKQQGFGVIMLSLGPFAVKHIASQLNVYSSELVFNGYRVERDSNLDWLNISYSPSIISEFPFKIETETIDESLLIPYAAAFQLVLADKLDPVKANVPGITSSFNQFLENRKFKVNSVVMLFTVFAALLINFFLFSWLSSANERLSAQVSRSAQSTDDLEKLNQQIAEKQALLKVLGWEGNINKSVLIDQVASLLPADITWNEAAVDPVDNSVGRSQKEVTFTSRRIRINGSSEKVIPVNEWIARIRTLHWVKNIQLYNYAYNNELNTGQFIILIDY